MPKRKAMLTMLALVAFGLPATALALRRHPRAQAPSPPAGHLPVASRSRGASEIGALYPSARATRHDCTASVVHSPRQNTLLTAAHCVVGSGAGMVFAPGQHGTRAPFGRWVVTAAYLEPAWIKRQDPHADVAFLTVAPRTINGVRTEIEQVVGGYGLGPAAARGQRVTVTGYPAGSRDDPITCAASVYLTDGFPSFDCHGFVGGTSGSPWLRATRHGPEIAGVIGGLHEGGCFDYTSYSPVLERDAGTAYRRASSEAPADIDPGPGDDGC